MTLRRATVRWQGSRTASRLTALEPLDLDLGRAVTLVTVIMTGHPFYLLVISWNSMHWFI